MLVAVRLVQTTNMALLAWTIVGGNIWMHCNMACCIMYALPCMHCSLEYPSVDFHASHFSRPSKLSIPGPSPWTSPSLHCLKSLDRLILPIGGHPVRPRALLLYKLHRIVQLLLKVSLGRRGIYF